MTPSIFVSMLALSLALAGPTEVEAPLAGPQPATAAATTSSDGALALERVRPPSRGYAAAATSVVVAGGALGGMVALQVSRVANARECARLLARDDLDLFEALAPVISCSLEGPALGRTAGAVGLTSLSIGMAGVAGLALGRGDVRVGTVIPRARIERRIKIGAAVLGTFAGILVTVPPALWRLRVDDPFSPTGIRVLQAQFIVADVAVVGAAVGAGILARAHQYRRHRPSVAVAPTLSAQGVGLSIAGRF